MAERTLIKSIRITQRNPFKYNGGTFKAKSDGTLEVKELIEIIQPSQQSNIDEFTNANITPSSIDDGCKMSIYQEGRHKKAIVEAPYTFDLKRSSRGDELLVYKGSSVETDEEVIKNALDALGDPSKGKYVQAIKGDEATQTGVWRSVPYRVLQNPYRETPLTVRKQWGSSNYYLNNGSKITITWIGTDDNVIYSSKDDFETAKQENNREIKYKILDLYPPDGDEQIKKSTGVDTSYRLVCGYTGSICAGKEFKYLIDVTRGQNSFVLEQNLQVSPPPAEIGPQPPATAAKPPDERSFTLNPKKTDKEVVDRAISIIKRAAENHPELPDWKTTADQLAACDPDTETCKIIPFIDFLAPKDLPPIYGVTPSNPLSDQVGLSASGGTFSNKLKIKLDGGTSIVSKDKENPLINASQYDFEVRTKTSFSIRLNIGDPPPDVITPDEIDVFDPLEELDDEYIEDEFSEEAILKKDLTIFLEQGDNDGNLLADLLSESNTTQNNNSGGNNEVKEDTTADTKDKTKKDTKGKNLSTDSGGGSGDRRFQLKTVIRGVTIFNGEVPDKYLGTITCPGLKGQQVEKHAAIKLSQLGEAYYKKFGVALSCQGPYRSFKGQNGLFDWPWFEQTGKARKIGSRTARSPEGTAAARPGTSKHGWGQAIDLGPDSKRGDLGFGSKDNPKLPDVKEKWEWMDKNAPDYDWINPGWAKLRGAGYEPWHFEYIGKDLFDP